MEFFLRDEWIKLGQLLKAIGWVSAGIEAKEAIQAGEVFVNGEVCLQRGRKCADGDRIHYQNKEVTVKSGVVNDH